MLNETTLKTAKQTLEKRAAELGIQMGRELTSLLPKALEQLSSHVTLRFPTRFDRRQLIEEDAYHKSVIRRTEQNRQISEMDQQIKQATGRSREKMTVRFARHRNRRSLKAREETVDRNGQESDGPYQILHLRVSMLMGLVLTGSRASDMIRDGKAVTVQVPMYSTTGSTHSTTTTVAKFLYDDFSTPTPLRSARVIVEGRSVYVNPGWLAEFSNFFATMFFGKSADEDLTLGDDVSYEHFIELLRVACYCPARKPITIANVTIVLKMACYFGMKPLIEKCEDVIARKASTLDRVKLFQIACAVAEHDRFSPTMTLLIDKLSTMKREELSKLHFSQVPGDVVADVFAAKMKRSEMKRKKWCCFL
uniref:BTB domain-containing protein n=1 Tax=Setaria digitata TaxID=48799 RepID=A0A915Q705_9BILA